MAERRQQMRFVDRIGAALVSPRRALEAADRGEGGMPDAMWLLILKIVCTETPLLFSALWGVVVRGPQAVIAALLAHLGTVLGWDLILLALAGFAITIGAGARRDMTRDFDMAAVAWVPVLAVGRVAMLFLRVFEIQLTSAGQTVLRVIALSWMLGVCALAVRHARRRPARQVAP